MSTAAARQVKGPVDGIAKERRWPFALLTLLWVAGAFVLANIIIGLAIAVGIGAGVRLDLDPNLLNAAGNVLVFSLTLALILGLPRLLKLWSGRLPYRRLLGFTRVLWWRDILFAAVAYVIYFAALITVVGLVSLIPGYDANQAQTTGFSATLTPGTALIVFVSLVVIPPIVEETIFRGYLFGTLRRSVPVWVAALLTSGLFGLAHLQLNVGVDAFVLGLFSCFLRHKTGSLWASVLLHMIKNGVAFYALYVASHAIM